MKSLKPPTSRILPSTLALITILTFSTTITTHFPSLQNYIIPTKCILYDRPPRTASTTISIALSRCIRRKNYTIHPSISGFNRTHAIRSMLSSPSRRLAAIKTHIAVSANDIRLLHTHCADVFYVTSCASMRKRLYSAAKYAATGGHGNTTLDARNERRVMKVLRKHVGVEDFLEAYPYVTEERRPMENVPRRMVPDFVVRYGSLEKDLAELLEALGCHSGFSSENVHEIKGDEKRALEDVEVRRGDAIYRWLMNVARGNDVGLEKAKRF